MKKEFIICAAIWYNDGKEHIHQPKNIKKGFVICGRSHHNCYATASALTSENVVFLTDLKTKISTSV